MADLPKRVWSGKKQVYSWKKPVWVKDWKLWVYDPNFEEVDNWQYYSPNRWGNLSSDAELQIYDDKDSLNPTDIGTFEDWLESTYQFVDYDSTVLKSWKVKDWETPVAPADPTREHYTFTGWNPTVWPISKNTTYSAMYIASAIPVTELDDWLIDGVDVVEWWTTTATMSYLPVNANDFSALTIAPDTESSYSWSATWVLTSYENWIATVTITWVTTWEYSLRATVENGDTSTSCVFHGYVVEPNL